MSLRIDLRPAAKRELENLPRAEQQRILGRIARLAEAPRPPRAVPLGGAGGLLRVRVGDYRVVYRIDTEPPRILVVRIGHRREVYRNLPSLL